MRIVAVDPGGTTGWCSAKISENKESLGELDRINTGESVQNDLGNLMSMVAGLRPRFIVFEDFVLYPGRNHSGGTAKTGIAPMFVIGFMRGAVDRMARSRAIESEEERKWARSVRWVPQMASAAKHFATDARLRSWDQWVVGSPHERDAVRHALLFARKYADARGSARDLGESYWLGKGRKYRDDEWLK